MDLTRAALTELLDRQLSFFCATHSAAPYLDEALACAEHCFAHVTNKYFHAGDAVRFSPFHAAQNGIFLYYLSRAAHRTQDRELADKIYYLNKMLHSVDWFYEVELPDVFFADHPQGCVLGRAVYADRFCAAQNVTVGNNHGVYPTFCENVTLHLGAAVVGDSHIGRNVEVAAGAFVCDADVPDNCIVFGRSPHLILKPRSFAEMRGRLTQFDYTDITE